MIKYIALLITITLSSCSFRIYDNDVRLEFPKGTIYKIDDRNYLMSKDGVFYHIEYFKDNRWITNINRL